MRPPAFANVCLIGCVNLTYLSSTSFIQTFDNHSALWSSTALTCVALWRRSCRSRACRRPLWWRAPLGPTDRTRNLGTCRSHTGSNVAGSCSRWCACPCPPGTSCTWKLSSPWNWNLANLAHSLPPKLAHSHRVSPKSWPWLQEPINSHRANKVI